VGGSLGLWQGRQDEKRQPAVLCCDRRPLLPTQSPNTTNTRQSWHRLSGMPKQQAMQQYTQLAEQRLGTPSSAAAGRSGGGGGSRGGAKGGSLGGPVMSRLVYGDDGDDDEEEGDSSDEGKQPGSSGNDEGQGGSGSNTAGGGSSGRREGALHALAGQGNAVKLTALLDGGADVDARDGTGCTPLHFAADRGAVDALRLLVARGAEVDARDEDGQTPLHYAAVCGQRAVRLGCGLAGEGVC